MYFSAGGRGRLRQLPRSRLWFAVTNYNRGITFFSIAQRVKRRTGRQQVSHFAGAYQDLATQQRLADEEKQRLADIVEIRDAGPMGEGLFALQDLQPGELQLAYFGKHFSGEPRYLDDFPNDDAINLMELQGEYFDGTPIDRTTASRAVSITECRLTWSLWTTTLTPTLS